MAITVFILFFVSTMQALVCRSVILGVLGLVCLASSAVMCFTADFPRWVRLMAVMIPISLLIVIIQQAGIYDGLYLGKILQYRIAIGYCIIAIGCHLLFLLPEAQKAAPPEREATQPQL